MFWLICLYHGVQPKNKNNKCPLCEDLYEV